MTGFQMDDYVDVAQRIHEFYERFPDGSLRTGTAPHVMLIGDRPFVVYHAQAWRTPEDPCPADGWAWEPVPGPTQFTKDSELMNAETAAWGRAIVALGFSTKKIASAQEVRARQGSAVEPTSGRAGSSAAHHDIATDGSLATEAQQKLISVLTKKLAMTEDEFRSLFGCGPEAVTKAAASKVITALKEREAVAA